MSHRPTTQAALFFAGLVMVLLHPFVFIYLMRKFARDDEERLARLLYRTILRARIDVLNQRTADLRLAVEENRVSHPAMMWATTQLRAVGDEAAAVQEVAERNLLPHSAPVLRKTG